MSVESYFLSVSRTLVVPRCGRCTRRPSGPTKAQNLRLAGRAAIRTWNVSSMQGALSPFLSMTCSSSSHSLSSDVSAPPRGTWAVRRPGDLQAAAVLDYTLGLGGCARLIRPGRYINAALFTSAHSSLRPSSQTQALRFQTSPLIYISPNHRSPIMRSALIIPALLAPFVTVGVNAAVGTWSPEVIREYTLCIVPLPF